MPVSAILLAALAPITGALFGASYGTSIRIGYEIIFPALFGDMINEQKNKPNMSQEEGAKRTIKALHTMFTATGGASAMEFGIEQGIEMAKKKTESPAVQSMIDLSLGLTDRQIRRRGRGASNAATQLTDVTEVEEFEAKPQGDVGDFEGLSYTQVFQLLNKMDKIDFGKSLVLLEKENRNTNEMKLFLALYRKKFPASQNVAGTEKVIITRFTTDKNLVIKRIAQIRAQMQIQLTAIRRGISQHYRSNAAKVRVMNPLYLTQRKLKSDLLDALKKLKNIETLERNR